MNQRYWFMIFLISWLYQTLIHCVITVKKALCSFTYLLLFINMSLDFSIFKEMLNYLDRKQN